MTSDLLANATEIAPIPSMADWYSVTHLMAEMFRAYGHDDVIVVFDHRHYACFMRDIMKDTHRFECPEWAHPIGDKYGFLYSGIVHQGAVYALWDEGKRARSDIALVGFHRQEPSTPFIVRTLGLPDIWMPSGNHPNVWFVRGIRERIAGKDVLPPIPDGTGGDCEYRTRHTAIVEGWNFADRVLR